MLGKQGFSPLLQRKYLCNQLLATHQYMTNFSHKKLQKNVYDELLAKLNVDKREQTEQCVDWC